MFVEVHQANYRQDRRRVAYDSAYIEGVASELIVRSDHFTQSHPEMIEAVRRARLALYGTLQLTSCLIPNISKVFR